MRMFSTIMISRWSIFSRKQVYPCTGQRQNTVAAYFISRHILPFAFPENHSLRQLGHAGIHSYLVGGCNAFTLMCVNMGTACSKFLQNVI